MTYNPWDKKLLDLYLDWTNEWLTIDRFADHHNMPVDQMVKILEVGKYLHVRGVEQHKFDRAMAKAKKEGWCIEPVRAPDDYITACSDWPLRLQRLDDISDFANDMDVWQFVNFWAKEGEEHFIFALEYLKKYSLSEYKKVIHAGVAD